MAGITIAVHGGAGAPRPGDEDRREAREAALADSLRAGLGVLSAGGTALAAVVAAVEVLEDAEDFNAGRGSVLTAAGTVEMDAAVAGGAGRRAGAVAGVTGVRHPVAAARAVLDDGRHVLLAGPAATEFARRAGLAFERPEWFITERRRWEAEARGGSTVGAVALDGDGHLAAATSTGGRAGQLPGRVGDSPVIGAGTGADDDTCAVSGTGDGEAFLRASFAHEVDAQLRLAGCALDEACRRALARVEALGGAGGCVALDRDGRAAMPHTTPVMHRGWGRGDGELWVSAGPWPIRRARR
jgi:L-asparaginase / beta-aspartyl-peptidase